MALGRVVNQEIMKLNSQVCLFLAIRKPGPVSRFRLQGKTGFGWRIITSLTKELLDGNIILERRNFNDDLGEDLDRVKRWIKIGNKGLKDT